MDPRVTSKDMIVSDRNYRLKKMEPRLACWLFSALYGKQSDDGILLTSLSKCSKDEFDEIQGYSLRYIYFLEEKEGTVFEIPIVGVDGRWADKNLTTDPGAVLKLTQECIMFNVSPFLSESTSKEPPPLV